MGVRDNCPSFTATPAGQGCYRDLNGAYHYAADNTAVQPNFQLSEFNTEGCRPYGIMLKLAQGLQAMRTALGVSVSVTSGYRNPMPGQCGHDTSVNVQWHEPHADGLAADVNVPGKTYIEVAQAAHDAGFLRIEVIKDQGQSFGDHMSASGHVHVDVYDGSSNTTNGTMYDSPASGNEPAFPWYAYGNTIPEGSYTTSDPNTWNQLSADLHAH